MKERKVYVVNHPYPGCTWWMSAQFADRQAAIDKRNEIIADGVPVKVVVLPVPQKRGCEFGIESEVKSIRVG